MKFLHLVKRGEQTPTDFPSNSIIFNEGNWVDKSIFKYYSLEQNENMDLRLEDMSMELYTGPNNELPSGISTTLPEGTRLYWNQLAPNSNFKSTYSPWGVYDKTYISISNTLNGCLLTKTGSGGQYTSNYALSYWNINPICVGGHVYYCHVYVYPSILTNVGTQLFSGGWENNVACPSNTWTKVHNIFNNVVAGRNNLLFHLTNWIGSSIPNNNTCKLNNIFLTDVSKMFGLCSSLTPQTKAAFDVLFPSLDYAPYDEGTNVVVHAGKLYKIKTPKYLTLYTGPNNEIPEGINTTLDNGQTIMWNQLIHNNRKIETSINGDNGFCGNYGKTVNHIAGNHYLYLYDSKSTGTAYFSLNGAVGGVGWGITRNNGYIKSADVKTTPNQSYKKCYYDIYLYNNVSTTGTGVDVRSCNSSSTYTSNDICYVKNFNMFDVSNMFSNYSSIPITWDDFNKIFPNFEWAPYEPGINLIAYNGKLYKFNLPNKFKKIYGSNTFGIGTTLPNGIKFKFKQLISESSYQVTGGTSTTDSNGYINIVGTDNAWRFHYTNVNNENHKYYYKTFISSDKTPIFIETSKGWNKSQHTASTNKTIVDGILSISNSGDTLQWLQIFSQSPNTNLNVYKRTIFIDLTEIYGAGNEPSNVDNFKKDFPNVWDISYDPGTWVSVYNGRLYELK